MGSTGVPKLVVQRFRSWPKLKLPREIIAEQQAKRSPGRRRSMSVMRLARKALRRHVYLIAVGLCAGAVAYGIASAVAASPQPNTRIEAMIKPYSEILEPEYLVNTGNKRGMSCDASGRKKQTGYRTIKRGNLVLHVPKEKEDLTPVLNSYELDQRRKKGRRPTRSGKKGSMLKE